MGGDADPGPGHRRHADRQACRRRPSARSWPAAPRCAPAAGMPVAGGHSIDSVEPIYGLVALGLVHPDRVLTNRTARAGDVLILTKALGVGVLSAAFKQERLDAAGYAALIASTTQLNTVGRELRRHGRRARGDRRHRLRPAGPRPGDVPGRRPGRRDRRRAPPLLAGVEALARAGVRTGASAATGRAMARRCALPADLPDWRRDLLTDPQTSGGLLIAVDPAEAETRAGPGARARLRLRVGGGPPEGRPRRDRDHRRGSLGQSALAAVVCSLAAQTSAGPRGCLVVQENVVARVR